MAADWGTVPQWVSTGITGAGLGVAIYASRAWRNTLRAKRGDDVLAAILDLDGNVGSAKAAVRRGVPKSIWGQQMDRLYASFLGLQKTFVVAARSHPRLEEHRVRALHEMIDRTVLTSDDTHYGTGAFNVDAIEPTERRFVNLERDVATLREHVRSIVR